ncbi:hypothetical protein KVT40_001758 [Elsinoe batatas]|uniref:Metallo-beta-lactamase domain-containing protein n=1 Tax=Elsinoe batatas TaxID=2601811 RepID=A0A8K0L5L3_9PEZI|nr:hypothetical protein KVT40_001758 [Elsinoe batatas]
MLLHRSGRCWTSTRPRIATRTILNSRLLSSTPVMRSESGSKKQYAPQDVHFPQYQGHCVDVSIIDGGITHMLSQMLVHPAPKQQKYLRLADYSFLIESRHRRQKALFDLGFMANVMERMPPVLKPAFANIADPIMKIESIHDVPTVLQTHRIPLSTINTIIWSHSHLDHTGDPSVFPPSTSLTVGPGFTTSCLPGYPTNPNSIILDSALANRELHEVSFTAPATPMTIGGFRAVDFFHDSSFWLLECPGHTGHHLGALARTTADSFLLRDKPGVSFYDLAPLLQEDLAQAEETLEKMRAFDARDDVLVVLAHDASLLDVVDVFPKMANGWREKGWGVKGRWGFLREMEREVDAGGDR